MQLRLWVYLFLLYSATTLCAGQDMPYSIIVIEGTDAIIKLIPFIAQQRITEFQEYPYLYQGNLTDEYSYLSWFAQLPSSAVAVAYDGDTPIGFVAGTAFSDFESHFQGSMELFKHAGLSPASYYYVSEAIVLAAYRDKSICRELVEVLEQHARQRGFLAGCFVCEHHEHHPLKPTSYKDLDPLFTKLGYQKTELTILFDWDTIQSDGSIARMSHPLSYWIKDF
jgi:ribosomal protein S18 acetylase RimI-like enzyme